MSPIETKEDDFTTDSERLMLAKARLECEKLEAEIAQVKLEWWKRPGYIGSLAPIVLAVVGFLSAFWTGYFDTRRETLEFQVNTLKTEQTVLEQETAQLRAQREALEHENQELLSKNAQIQNKIHETYISLKLARSDLAYAIGHFHACDVSLSDEDMAKLSSRVDPNDLAEAGIGKLFGELLSCYENMNNILPITEDLMRDYEEGLSKVPASLWAKELEPQIGAFPMLLAPDGRAYYPPTSQFYESVGDLERAVDN